MGPFRHLTLAYYAVHRTGGAGCGTESSRHLLAVPRAGVGAGRYNDPAPPSAGPVTYLVTAVSRLHHQSAPATVTLRD